MSPAVFYDGFCIVNCCVLEYVMLIIRQTAAVIKQKQGERQFLCDFSASFVFTIKFYPLSGSIGNYDSWKFEFKNNLLTVFAVAELAG